MAFRKNGDATHLGSVDVNALPSKEEEARLLELLKKAELDGTQWALVKPGFDVELSPNGPLKVSPTTK